MPDYLYIFGYETPRQLRNNKRNGWEDEDSRAITITAPDPQSALAWGDRIAQRYIAQLHDRPEVDWHVEGYASFIENDPTRFPQTTCPRVQTGEYPDFTAWLREDRQPPPPLFPLSWVRRQQRKAALIILPIIFLWIATIFAVSAFVRPLILRSAWFGLLIFLWIFISLPILGWAVSRPYRWFKLTCPWCGAAFDHLDLQDPTKTAEQSAQEQRTCSRCNQIIIDLDA